MIVELYHLREVRIGREIRGAYGLKAPQTFNVSVRVLPQTYKLIVVDKEVDPVYFGLLTPLCEIKAYPVVYLRIVRGDNRDVIVTCAAKYGFLQVLIISLLSVRHLLPLPYRPDRP